VKLTLLGDTHFNDKKPESRLDEDYLATMLGKFKQAVEIHKANKCDILIQVGDLFDSFRANNRIKSALTEYLRREELGVYCVYGQHDIAGHSESTFENSPMRVLEAAGVVHVLDDVFINPGIIKEDSIYLYGASFGQLIPKPEADAVFDVFNILVTHQMIGDGELYPGQNLKHPITFLREHPEYNLVVCGDYHYRFIEKNVDQYCINPGAMIRKSISDRDLAHEPAVVIFDTKTLKHEVIKLKVAAVEEIFDTTKRPSTSDEDKDYSALLSFIENLKKKEGAAIGWKEILLHVMNEENADDDVRDCIDKCISEVEKK
jgi:DNA repair exonuclease SbcCD nuclease subunit